MKQILQNLKNGETTVVEVPSPTVKPGHLRIQTKLSLISSGTERMITHFGKSNYLNKAKQQPDKVVQVLNKIKTDGLESTLNTVSARLDEPQPLGYSNIGIITHIGDSVDGFKVGDRVVSNGRHAEIVNVPKNLCAKIPDRVSDETAVFTVVSSIGLQGVRLANPTIGETFVVYGLGLIGLLTIQILKANGCRVLGLDISTERVEIAKMFGIEAIDLSQGADPISAGLTFSNGNGVDSVIITASTKDDSIIRNAAKMSRKRGRIVLIGVVGLKLNRSDFYDKELSFQVSCSYGPGRYDSDYEEQGNDYPIGFVRWTEKRNFEAVLELMASGLIKIKPLISSRVSLEESPYAYDKVLTGKDIATILQYPDQVAYDVRTITNQDATNEIQSVKINQPKIGMIGAGNFTKARLLPILKKTDVFLDTIVSAKGLSSYSAAKKFGFKNNTNDLNNIWSNEEIDTVFITTKHDSHADLVIKAIECGKNVFVEKPLALTFKELKNIQSAIALQPSSILMVGFNRRFAPHIIKMKTLLDARQQPKCFIFTINAGVVPADHWVQDSKVGGGRIIGEVCHFIDLIYFLSDSPIKEWSVQNMGNDDLKDKLTINLIFKNGSIGSIHYLANGSKHFPKERIEVFCDGSIIQMDNFRKMKGYGWPGFHKMNLWEQDKGHKSGIQTFLNSIRNGEPSPISVDELIEGTRITIAISNSI
jgi:predicted dehydrogenase/threonine dehydrogenase-like Zn-dependent dehydrogenase